MSRRFRNDLVEDWPQMMSRLREGAVFQKDHRTNWYHLDRGYVQGGAGTALYREELRHLVKMGVLESCEQGMYKMAKIRLTWVYDKQVGGWCLRHPNGATRAVVKPRKPRWGYFGVVLEPSLPSCLPYVSYEEAQAWCEWYIRRKVLPLATFTSLRSE